MRILYLSPSVRDYKSASYQREVMDELSLQADVRFYGPGFPDFDSTDSLRSVLEKCGCDEGDCICVGHAWLNDSDSGPISNLMPLDLGPFQGRKIMILNKEYARLDDKLDYVRKQGFDLVFTHHHEVGKYCAATGTRFVFWPFACDGKRFKPGPALPDRDYDLFFSGILQNHAHKWSQSDLRAQIQAELYYSVGELKIARRWKYRNLKLFWNAFSANRYIGGLDRKLGRYRRLTDTDYPVVMANSRAVLCCLSPLELVSPRYFESMACGSIALCEESERYEGLMKAWVHYVPFKRDLSDFDAMLALCASGDPRVRQISETAKLHVAQNHTWKIRIEQLLRELTAMR
jgi:spore maturation protein CgeB